MCSASTTQPSRTRRPPAPPSPSSAPPRERPPNQGNLPPLPKSEQSTRGEPLGQTPSQPLGSSTDWKMGSASMCSSKRSVQTSSVRSYQDSKISDVPMYPVQRRKRGRPKKPRQPLGYRPGQPLPSASVANSTRSRSTRGKSVLVESELESVPSSTDNLEPGADFRTYTDARMQSASSKELMPPPNKPIKRRLERAPSTAGSTIPSTRVPTKRKIHKPPSTVSPDSSMSQGTSASYSNSSSSSSSYMYPEPKYKEARGEKRGYTKVPRARWEYKLNARKRSTSSVTPKRAKS